ncbi:hypothetical protein V5N11_014405 [Cardamine amara subsp. amara]|uniref:Late embryogenesis abundant protein n=1 Tax=Cardamine amara subsp. amara TaxID=228776 RepID=A0ABD1C4Q8_CARAN
MAEKTTPTTTEKKTEQEVKDSELPTNSPYVATGTLEDYKMKGYGAEGHKEPKAGLGGGSTDAPTVSGDVAAEKGPTVLGDVAAAAAKAP